MTDCQKARCNALAAESALTLGAIGLGIFSLVKRFGVVRAGLGLYALDQVVFRSWRASAAEKHGGSAARSWDLPC
jgi:hypothetical protein